MKRRLPDLLILLAQEFEDARKAAAFDAEAFRGGVFFSKQDAGKAVATDGSLERWTLESGDWPKLEVTWPWQIELTCAEISRIASGELDELNVVECPIPGCKVLIRSGCSYCWFHEKS